jgi:hypothetical protein
MRAGDYTLVRAYDYVQDALANVEDGVHVPALSSIYKAIEVIENHMGGKRRRSPYSAFSTSSQNNSRIKWIETNDIHQSRPIR